MKRLLVFILAFSYLVTTTGADMHLHFCMGKLAGWSLWTNSEEKNCGKCGMEKKEKPSGCCKDESKWVKIQDDQKTTDYSIHFPEWQAAALLHFADYSSLPLLSNTTDLLPKSHAPPRSHKVESYILNCTFLI